MLEILPDAAHGRASRETVVRDRDGRVVGTTETRGGTTYVRLAPDAPEAVRDRLDPEDGRARLPDRFVAAETNDELRLTI